MLCICCSHDSEKNSAALVTQEAERDEHMLSHFLLFIHSRMLVQSVLNMQRFLMKVTKSQEQISCPQLLIDDQLHACKFGF